MGLHLFPHNKCAYEAAVRLMEEEGKAAIIHPTGTGKSFIAFQLAIENPTNKILWLAPSEYIYQTQVENLKRTENVSEEQLKNIQFRTYSKLMMNEDEIDSLHPNYIVLDEFHRCGASEWGKSVEKLLAAYPKARILGLSATNIRYLDGQRDMAAELFDGLIASEITLGEAIAKQILPAPTYVISMYSYQEELKRLQMRIANVKNPAIQKENETILEQLRRTLEQAEGLDQIFARYMKKEGGKYIVFCSSKEHMEEMISHVQQWFHLVDKQPHIYAVYYDNPQTSTAFAQFKADESQHLRLLFCIDMLNEGVHVEDIDGVILLRPTVSPIIYLQQIGRSLAAGKKKQPLIFDIVNNFDSLYTIDSLKEEIENAFDHMSCTEKEREHFMDQFRIIDELKDCRELFAQLTRNLSAGWELYYIAAMEFYQEKGHLRVPKSYVASNGLNLGMWLQTQRRVRAGKIIGNLSQEQIEKLDALGMEWDSGSVRSWNRGCEALKNYVATYGNADINARYVTEDNYPLGKWISNLRSKYKRGELSSEQIHELEDLGMIWSKHGSKWEQNYKAAEEYFASYGNLRVPHNYRTPTGICLGVWITNQRNIYLGKKQGAAPLSQRQIERLNAIEMVWK